MKKNAPNGTKCRKPRKRRRLKRVLKILLVVLLVLGALVGGFLYIFYEKRVFKDCHVEAGTPVEAADFVRFGFDRNSAAFANGTAGFDVHTPGEYPIEIQLGSQIYKSVLYVADTVAPKIYVMPKETMYTVPLTVEDFITAVDDESACKTEFVTTPAFDSVGTQDVQIACTDQGGNRTVVTTTLRVIGIYPEITMETGDPKPGISSFAFAEEDARLMTPLSTINMMVPGDYPVSFTVSGIQYDSVLHLKDTRPPEATGITYEGFACYPLKPEDLVEGVSDATEVTIEFVEDPHFETPGERDVKISLKDQGGNEQIVTAHINLKEDTEAPVITGAKDMSVLTNQSVAFKDGIEVTDNADKDVRLEVDNSQVDLTKDGTYKVIYSAKDAAGNETKVEVSITVVYRPYTEDDLWELCDMVLKDIIKDGMTEKQKVEAIFNWVDWSITYKGHAEKVTWVQGAYDGIKNRMGDCFNIASACHALYTRAGIETFMVERFPITYAQHFWNAVKIDGQWYFCDALTKEDGTRFFMWSASQMAEYSNSHRGYFGYDESKYPVKVP
ncbi:MAG: transglutaminase domain-containing protein [Clostridiales bacterium]|nr:transglutaminase domain-containing protein [Clostridiales bacterium]